MIDGYYKLVSAVILSGIIEQDMRYVVYTGGRFKKGTVLRARRFVKGKLFEHYCHLIGMNPEQMRKLSPETALKAFKQILKRSGGRGVNHRKEVIVGDSIMDSIPTRAEL